MRCGSCNEVFDGNAALLEPLPTVTPPALVPALPAFPHSPASRAAPFDEAAAQTDAPETPAASDTASGEPIYTLELDAAMDRDDDERRDAPLDEPVNAESGAPFAAAEPQWQTEPESGMAPGPEAANGADLQQPSATPFDADPRPEPETAWQGAAGIAEDQPPAAAEAAPEDPLDVKPMTHEELEAALAAELAVMEQSLAAEREAPDAPADAGGGRQEPTLDPDSRYDLDEADEEALVQLAAARERDTTPALHTLLRAASAPSQDRYEAPADAPPPQPPGPAAREEDIDDPDEPSFLKQERRRERYGKRNTIATAAGALLLVGALAAQGLTTFRNQLAASYPALKPTLQDICAALGCKIELPAQIDELVIEQGELQTLSETTFSFTTLLRNQSTTAQAWPHIELTLDDANDKAIVRRVFTPRDYLDADATLDKGFAPRSEQSVKLYFELKQLKASGYHIAVFYP